MKKILCGLISVSMISFATEPAISGAAIENTPVFQTGQIGKIPVKGSLSSKALEVKYVVYASIDETYDATEGEVLDLPSITILYFTSSSGSKTGLGFGSETPKKLYVRKVNGQNDGILPLGSEEVSYKVNLDPALNRTGTLVDDYISTFSKTFFTAFDFLSKTELDKVLAFIGDPKLSIASIPQMNFIYNSSNSTTYSGGSAIGFEIVGNGILSITAPESSYFSATPNFPSAVANQINSYFAVEKPSYPELSISVKVQ